jgi:glycosyltransferase involved in cell wall biosynthesis
VRTVLVIGPDFVPSSLPPALRIRLFATHLHKFGWKVIVLTVRPEYYENACDPENERLLPGQVEVIRTAAAPVRITRKFGIGDIGMRSLWHHWQALSRICRSRRIDLIFIPTPPWVPMILGRFAHLRFGIPYVIDYIDPWVSDYSRRLPSHQRPPKWRLAGFLSRCVEPFALKRASQIVGVSKRTTDGVVARYTWMSESDGTGIPYGAEPADFDYLRANPRPNRFFQKNDGMAHLCSIGRGGADLIPATAALFRAIQTGVKNSPDLYTRLRIHFIGTSYAPGGASCDIRILADRFGLGDIVQESSKRVAFLDAIQLLVDSDALLAIGSEQAHYTASKIFPYILAKKPIFAIFHEESSVLGILRESGAGIGIAFSADRPADACITEIEGRLTSWLQTPGNYAPETRSEAVAKYTAEAMTKRLAAVFDSVVTAPAARGAAH